MGDNKVARVLARIFNVLFFAVFSVLFLEVVFRRYGDKEAKNLFWINYKQHLIILAVATAFTVLAFLVYRFLIMRRTRSSARLRQHREDSEDGEGGKRILITIFVCTGIILILQYIAAYKLWCNPLSDSNRLNVYAQDFARTGNFDLIQKDYDNNYFYMICYPHNFLPMAMQAVLFRIWYLITGNITRFPMLVLNVLFINSAILMASLIARKVYGGKQALYVIGLSALFVPFYTYTAYLYTDTFSIPFTMGSVLLLVYAERSEKRVGRIVLFALSGIVAFLGFKMKGNVIVVFVAVLIYIFLKLGFKRFISAALAFVVGFGCMWGVYTATYKAAAIATPEQSYEREIPATHWIMMGLKGHGGFDWDEYYYTADIIGKDEKAEANMEVIKERLKKMGVPGLLQHLTTKAVWTWGDGTYYISLHISDPIHENILHEYVLDSGHHYYRMLAYCCGFQLFLLLMMALSALKGIIRPRCDGTMLFRIIVFGVFLFLLIWETRARYLFTFTPFFLLLAVDGVDSGIRVLHRVKEIAKRNKE